ncbi:hypothetical protein PVBG_01470 [Plasmodium vivax Brazil I]|uniref:WD domain, G-beta repeat domain-containing protein n=1 Tax=Plasmodium vivax (strain Brazil I) TaxID=1033975 RepID=A0A0J9SQN6_PLAV1|nr:hypothetical protein PVBG_01470 [Plasmodium vivax Brazil I]
MEEGNARVDSISQQACQMNSGRDTHVRRRVFYIVQEVPYADFYNFDYGPIDKFRESAETQCIDGDASSSSSSSSSGSAQLGDGGRGKAPHERRCGEGVPQRNSAEYEGEKRECAEYYQGGEHPNGGNPSGGALLCGGQPNGGHPPGGAPRKSESREAYPLADNLSRGKTHPKKGPKKGKRKNEFLKQCEFSSDGSCYYTISNGNHLRLFATDPLLLNELSKGEEGKLNLRALHEQYEHMNPQEREKRNESWVCMQLGEHIYDCKFYPFFDWSNSNTCFFAACSKGNPVCLHSAYDGSSIMSFKPLNECHELCSCYSLCFHPERNWLLCGTNAKSIKVFDFGKPSEVYENRILSTRRGKGQKGIISTMAYKKNGFGKNAIYAVGDYSDCIYLYADNCDHTNDFILKFQVNRKNSNGVTCIKWLDEFSLLSGSRNGSFIYRFDMRKATEYTQKWERFALTNQKYLFDVYGDFLLSGDTFGYLNVYNLAHNKLIYREQINKYSPLISVHVHPTYPLLLTGSGTRRFYENSTNQVDIMASVLSRGVHTSDRNLVEEDSSCAAPFPSVSRYINSVCTVWCDFPP